MPLAIIAFVTGIAVLLGTSMAQAASGFFKESPLLAAKVEAGELPPVAERLPRNPVLVDPVERLGRYGGTWRMGMRGNSDRALIYRTIGYEHLLRWDPAWTRVVPNVAQSLSINDDATEFTFGLRQGMRWSDGQPFTADDIMFWYEDVLKNPELTPDPAPWFVAGGKLVEVDKLDSVTVRFRFTSPNGLFPQYIASGQDSGGPANFPKHWLKRFHKRHNPDGLAAEMEAVGASHWVELFRLKSADEHVPKSIAALFRHKISGEEVPTQIETWPTLNAWVLSEVESGDPPKIVAKRNPYYWKVDPGGQQLPYLDKVEYGMIDSQSEIVEYAKSGNIDMMSRRISNPKFYKDLASSQDIGDYHFFSLTPANSNSLVVALNLTHPDPAKKAIYGNREFRIALSLAIDRVAIIERTQAVDEIPYQLAPRPESRFYNSRLAHQYTEYLPERANSMLDDLGLNRRDDEGFRLRTDGERVAISMLAREDRSSAVLGFEMIAEYWRAVGIEAEIQAVGRKDLEDRVTANAHDAAQGHSDGGMEALLSPGVYLPWGDLQSVYGVGWVRWLADPSHEQAHEPPEIVKNQIDLFQTIQAAVTPEAQEKIMQRVLDIAADQFYLIGINLIPPNKGVVSNRFHNVPPIIPWSFTYPNPAPTNPSQYFIEP
jgi:peptide/nickel transport system substrate-binding protein